MQFLEIKLREPWDAILCHSGVGFAQQTVPLKIVRLFESWRVDPPKCQKYCATRGKLVIHRASKFFAPIKLTLLRVLPIVVARNRSIVP